MNALRPGDVVTCALCSASVTAKGHATWAEGDPVSLMWTHGPHLRWEVLYLRPERCIWCKERGEAIGAAAPPLFRPRDAGEGPLNVGTTEAPAAPPGSGGNKAPLERRGRVSQLGLF